MYRLRKGFRDLGLEVGVGDSSLGGWFQAKLGIFCPMDFAPRYDSDEVHGRSRSYLVRPPGLVFLGA